MDEKIQQRGKVEAPFRVLKRIPEHFEEIFYEVAMVTLPNGEL